MLKFSQRRWWGYIHLVIGKTGVRLQNKPRARTYCCTGLDQQYLPSWLALPYLSRSRWNIEIMDKGKKSGAVSVLYLPMIQADLACLAGKRLCIRGITSVIRWASGGHWFAPTRKSFGRSWQWKDCPAWTCPRYATWVTLINRRFMLFNSIYSALQTCRHGSRISPGVPKIASTCQKCSLFPSWAIGNGELPWREGHVSFEKLSLAHTHGLCSAAWNIAPWRLKWKYCIATRM